MTRLLGWCALVLLAGSIYAIDTPYSCSGTVPCDSSCDTANVSCLDSGTANGSTKCHVISDGTSVTCKTTTLDGDLISLQKSYCEGCDDNDDGPTVGEGCDPTLPNYWVYCNPFDY